MKGDYKSFTKASRFSRPERVRTEEMAWAMDHNTLRLCINVERQGLKRLEIALKTPDNVLSFMPHDLPYPSERYERRKANLDIALVELERRRAGGPWPWRPKK